MKKLILIITIVFSGMLMQAQSITTSYYDKKTKTTITMFTDEFTGDKTIKTKYRVLVQGWDGTINARYRKINDIPVLDMKIMLAQGVFAIDEGETIMLKLESGKVIKLHNSAWRVTSIGSGSVNLLGSSAPGMHIPFILSDGTIEILKNDPVTSIRIYTTEGFIDMKTSLKGKQRLVNSFLALN